jgi:hypothetical protein
MSNIRDGGKGHKPRPLPNREQFDKNWADIFKNHEKETNIPQPEVKEKK